MEKEIIILSPKKLKTIRLLLISLTFTIGAFTFIDKKPLLGWSCISFFGLGFIVFVIQLFPNASFLKLTQDGFEVRSLYRSHLTRWSNIKSFRAGFISIPVFASFGTFLPMKKKMVFYDYKMSNKKHRVGKSFSKALSGSEAALPDLFGMNVDELAELMNKWKDKNRLQQ